jgi:hypothetical protein
MSGYFDSLRRHSFTFGALCWIWQPVPCSVPVCYANVARWYQTFPSVMLCWFWQFLLVIHLQTCVNVGRRARHSYFSHPRLHQISSADFDIFNSTFISSVFFYLFWQLVLAIHFQSYGGVSRLYEYLTIGLDLPACTMYSYSLLVLAGWLRHSVLACCAGIPCNVFKWHTL